MLCQKCQCVNNYNASYCKQCGQPFSDEQKQESYNKTWMHTLDNVEDMISTLKLEKITGHKFVRIGIIVVLLCISVFNIFTNGKDVSIEHSQYYDVQYNVNTHDYYLLSDHDSFGLQLYIPYTPDTITVSKYDSQHTLLSGHTYTKDDEIIISNEENIYYKIDISNDKHLDQLTVSVYSKDSYK